MLWGAIVSIFTSVVGAQVDEDMVKSTVSQGHDSLDIETKSSVVSATHMTAVEKYGGYTLSDFSEFVDITATADMDIWDEAVWTTKWMFQKKSFEELVVLYGYPLKTICDNKLASNVAGSLKAYGAFILPAIHEVGISEIPSTQKSDSALAYIGKEDFDSVDNPLIPICDADTNRHQRVEDWNYLAAWVAESSEIDWAFIEQGAVGAKLAHSFGEITVDAEVVQKMAENTIPTYLVTAAPLGIIDPATEIWARCNVDKPEYLGTACKAALKSPKE